MSAGGISQEKGGTNLLTFLLSPFLGVLIWGGVYAAVRGIWNVGYDSCGNRENPGCDAGTGFAVLSIFIVGIAVLAYLAYSSSASSRGALIHLFALPAGALVAWVRVTVTGVANYHGDVNVIFLIVCLTGAAYVFGYLFLMKVVVGGPGERFRSLRRFRSRYRAYDLPQTPAEFRIYFGVLAVDLLSVPVGIWLFSHPFS
jgi:hypothetical protein